MENAARTAARRRLAARRRTALPDGGRYVETLLTQSVVCAMMLVVVFAVCFIRLPLTERLREGLKSVVGTSADPAETMEMLKSPVSGVRNSLSELFGGVEEKQVPATLPEAAALPDGAAPDMPSPGAEATGAITEARVDEDILARIHNRYDPYAEALKKRRALMHKGHRIV